MPVHPGVSRNERPEMERDSVLVSDLGGTRLRVAVVGPGDAIVSKEVMRTPKGDPGALARTMAGVLEKAGRSIAGAVVGVPGPVDYSRGEVVRLPNLPSAQSDKC